MATPEDVISARLSLRHCGDTETGRNAAACGRRPVGHRCIHGLRRQLVGDFVDRFPYRLIFPRSPRLGRRLGRSHCGLEWRPGQLRRVTHLRGGCRFVLFRLSIRRCVLRGTAGLTQSVAAVSRPVPGHGKHHSAAIRATAAESESAARRPHLPMRTVPPRRVLSSQRI